jgi:hypothetical protein
MDKRQVFYTKRVVEVMRPWEVWARIVLLVVSYVGLFLFFWGVASELWPPFTKWSASYLPAWWPHWGVWFVVGGAPLVPEQILEWVALRRAAQQNSGAAK